MKQFCRSRHYGFVQFVNTTWIPMVVIFLSLISAMPNAVAQTGVSEERIKQLALEAILENPEILEQALEKLRSLEAQRAEERIKQALVDRRSDLEDDPNAPVLGNPEGSITVVEFFDYNCPYCKRAMDPLKELLASDNRVRLVYREWPILGQDSLIAAQLALAARKQNAYEAMHWKIMASERANRESALSAAKELGLDTDQLLADMNDPEILEHIQKSMELADTFGIRGTPAFIIGDQLAPGFIPLSRLQQMVEEADNTNRQ